MILGIDTSLGTAVAVVEADGIVRADEVSENPLGHAEVIGDLLQRAVTAASDPSVQGAPPPGADDTITHVAAGMGPGPFTGLRVGIAAARAFAQGRGIPVIPVASHDAAALAQLIDTVAAGEPVRRFAVVTDARRREFAYTVYDDLDDDGLPVRASEPALIPRDQLDTRLAELGAGRRDSTTISAVHIALVAARALAAGREIGPADALYLRSPDVTMATARKRVGT